MAPTEAPAPRVLPRMLGPPRSALPFFPALLVKKTLTRLTCISSSHAPFLTEAHAHSTPSYCIWHPLQQRRTALATAPMVRPGILPPLAPHYLPAHFSSSTRILFTIRLKARSRQPQMAGAEGGPGLLQDGRSVASPGRLLRSHGAASLASSRWEHVELRCLGRCSRQPRHCSRPISAAARYVPQPGARSAKVR